MLLSTNTPKISLFWKVSSIDVDVTWDEMHFISTI